MARFTNAVVNPSQDSWKAQAFLNFYLPGKDGSRKKLGAIPLHERKSNEAALIEWLREDPERAQVIINKLEMEVNFVSDGDAAGFDL